MFSRKFKIKNKRGDFVEWIVPAIIMFCILAVAGYALYKGILK